MSLGYVYKPSTSYCNQTYVVTVSILDEHKFLQEKIVSIQVLRVLVFDYTTHISLTLTHHKNPVYLPKNF